MRDDFDITTANIDLIADTAVGAGALGARMTGGGFGGCVIALVPADRAEAVGVAVRDAVLVGRLRGARDHPHPRRPGRGRGHICHMSHRRDGVRRCARL